MQDPIAERRMTFKEAGTGPEQACVVRIGRPFESDKYGGMWAVEFEIDGPGDHHHDSCVYGSDSLQAIGNALNIVNACIDPVRRDGALTWDGSDIAGHVPT